MRQLLTLLNVSVLIALTFLAQDNLIAIWQSISAREHEKTESVKISQSPSNIEVLFSPNGGATLGIIKAISEARSSILVAAYSFTSKEIAEALLAAKKKDVSVKLILDRSQAAQKYSAATFFSNMGFDIRIDDKHSLYHNKFIIIDERTVITGSFNFTKAAEKKNAENVLIIRNNPKLADLYQKNFLQHWQQ